MACLVAYRVQIHRAPEVGEVGPYLDLQKPAFDPADYDFQVTPICIQLANDVRVARSGANVWLLYRNHHAYGLRLEDALRAGWAKVVDTPPTTLNCVCEEDDFSPAGDLDKVLST